MKILHKLEWKPVQTKEAYRMRLNYMGYQIEYLDSTGDVTVYKNEKMIMHASMSRWLSSREVIDSLSYVFGNLDFPEKDEANCSCDIIYTGEDPC